MTPTPRPGLMARVERERRTDADFQFSVKATLDFYDRFGTIPHAAGTCPACDEARRRIRGLASRAGEETETGVLSPVAGAPPRQPEAPGPDQSPAGRPPGRFAPTLGL